MRKSLLSQQDSSYDSIRAVEWKNDHLVLLDQRKLPQSEQYVELYNAEDTAEAIRNMVVRGAPAIGIAAAYGLFMAARKCYKQYPTDWIGRLENERELLANARPTAVNLHWALQRMWQAIEHIEGDPLTVLFDIAQTIHQDDIAANYRMGELGSALIEPTQAVLTHCNTGSLATGGYGTALGVIRSAFASQRIQQVYADETRPWWQGARLTAWELAKDHIPTLLLCEGAAAYLMRQRLVTWVIVGADRIAANGDVANKVGTYSLAVNARFHRIKFMVVAPTSTIDLSTAKGGDIPIEYRSPDEVLLMNNTRIAAQGVSAWNPSFDVTPAMLVDALVTEKGVVLSPNEEKIRELMAI